MPLNKALHLQRLATSADVCSACVPLNKALRLHRLATNLAIYADMLMHVKRAAKACTETGLPRVGAGAQGATNLAIYSDLLMHVKRPEHACKESL